MSNPDWIPFISQWKSIFQLCFCDVRGAKKTQYKFFTTCPVIAHAVGVLILPFNEKLGRSAIKKGFKTILKLFEAVPLVGIGLSILYSFKLKKKKRARKVFLLSCRTTLVAMMGIVGYIGRMIYLKNLNPENPDKLSGGELCSIAASTTYGVVFDALQSSIFTKDDKEGVWALCDHRKPGHWFDAFYDLSEDAMTGYGAGAIAYLLISKPSTVTTITQTVTAL